MLVLTRRPDETIVFPELGITVEVIMTKGNKVRLGIKAPDSVRILRGELEKFATEFEGITNSAMSQLAVSSSLAASVA